MHAATPSALAATSARPPVAPRMLSHKELRDDEYWRAVPGYAGLSAEEFHDHHFQVRNAITSVARLQQVLGPRVPDSFYEDASQGGRRAPMSLRVSPYLVSLIDWDNPYDDPLRIQFIPVASRQLPDHPEVRPDALGEQGDAAAPGLTHRYFDRALFLALDTCPVYCRFCTRSYAVGLDTEEMEKVHFGARLERWEEAFAYIASRPEVEDVVISGGDVSNLKPEHIELIGMRLLGVEHVRRLRYATKGPAVIPQKLVSDLPWVDALTRVVQAGRQRHKEVVLHTHFNHPNEITGITRRGLDGLMERGVTVRNQSVLQRRVNDDPETMQLLVRRLSFLNVHPYYVFVHDLVPGVEDLRTSLGTALSLEKQVRGLTAGFNTPTFVVDTPGGGGKRDAHSFEHYDLSTGISVYTSPTVKPGALFLYFDPLHSLAAEAQRRWSDPAERRAMMEAARRAALDKSGRLP